MSRKRNQVSFRLVLSLLLPGFFSIAQAITLPSSTAGYSDIGISVFDLDLNDSVAAGYYLSNGRWTSRQTMVQDNLGPLLTIDGFMRELSVEKDTKSFEMKATIAQNLNGTSRIQTSLAQTRLELGKLSYAAIQLFSGRASSTPAIDGYAMYLQPNTRLDISFLMTTDVNLGDLDAKNALAVSSLQFLVGTESFSTTACLGSVAYTNNITNSCMSNGYSVTGHNELQFNLSVSSDSNGRALQYFELRSTNSIEVLTAIPEPTTPAMLAIGGLIVFLIAGRKSLTA